MIVTIHRIADALASRQAEIVRIQPPAVKLFVGDRWVPIGRTHAIRTRFGMALNVPPLARLVGTPEAKAAGWDRWAQWGPQLN